MREIRKCPTCPNEFETDNRANRKTLCPECRQKVKNARDRKAYKYVPQEDRKMTIVDDPDKEVCFSKDVSFCPEEHKAMLQNKSYTPGTILEGDGRQWKVVNKDGKQRLIPWATPQKIYEYIEVHPDITIQELAKGLGMRLDDIRHSLARMDKEGYLLFELDEKLSVAEQVRPMKIEQKPKVYNPFVELLDYIDVE